MVLRRIESALTRLEAAVRQADRGPALDTAPDLAPRLAEAEASNARLREAVVASLQQIDGLIARQGAEPRS